MFSWFSPERVSTYILCSMVNVMHDFFLIVYECLNKWKVCLIPIQPASQYKCVFNNLYHNEFLEKQSNYWMVDFRSTHGWSWRFMMIYEGSGKVKNEKLQTHTKKFDGLKMKDKENFFDLLGFILNSFQLFNHL